MKERAIEQHLVKRVREAGGMIRKVRWIGAVGCPDRVVMWPVHPFGVKAGLHWIEVKSSTGGLRQSQIREIIRLRRCGQCVYVFNSIREIDTYIWDHVHTR